MKLEDMFKECLQESVTETILKDARSIRENSLRKEIKPVKFREGQYVNKVFLLSEGFDFKCSAGLRYEIWFSPRQNVIIENLHENHCMIYKVFDN